jgi:hypothetical protein
LFVNWDRLRFRTAAIVQVVDINSM